MKRQFEFEIKSVGDEGMFTGLASTYGNVDLGGDMILAGAFTKTLAEKGGRVPLLNGHDTRSPIGVATIMDSPQGLIVKGELVLEADGAKSAYALLKKGVIRGLSIGYDTMKSTMDGGVRKLSELKLWEISLTAFPMNPDAMVTAVKSEHDAEAEQIRAFRDRKSVV